MIMIDAATDATTVPVYGPYILWIIIASIPPLIGFGVWVTKTLSKQNTALAVLVSETRAPIKVVNEVIDLKLASAELNEHAKGHDAKFIAQDLINQRLDRAINTIWRMMESDIEDTKTRERFRREKDDTQF